MLPNDYPPLFEAYSELKLLPANSELGKSLNGLARKIAGVARTKEKAKSKSTFSLF